MADRPASAPGPVVDADRVIADLRALHRRTGDDAGAQRLCWSPGWREARSFLTELLDEIGLTAEVDDAGNLWSFLEGEREPALVLGSHIDSVPDGGRLDGALGVMAAVGVLRAWAGAGRPPERTLAFVDFADEEGARFGRSLFGSSAVTGALDPGELEGATDSEGRTAAEVLSECGVELGRAAQASGRLGRIDSYMELHIEQGPVLESAGASLAAVTGCVGIERLRFEIRGQASHAGTTPMDMRRDAGLAAAEAALALERIGATNNGVATTGQLRLDPGISTAVPGRADLVADLRHRDGERLAQMLEQSREAMREAAQRRACSVTEHAIWRIDPVGFDSGLVDLAAEEAGGKRLTSGALHDAAAVARVRPAAMLFVPSTGGISHAAEEDTPDDDLRAGIEAFGRFANRAMARG